MKSPASLRVPPKPERAVVETIGLIVLKEGVPWPESAGPSLGSSPPLFLVFTLIVVTRLCLTFSNEVVFVFHATRMK